MNFLTFLSTTLAAVGANHYNTGLPSEDYAAWFNKAKNLNVLVRSVNRALLDQAKVFSKISPKVDQYHQEVSRYQSWDQPYQAYVRSYHLKNDATTKYNSAKYLMNLIRNHAKDRAWELNRMKRPTEYLAQRVHQNLDETLGLYNKTIHFIYQNEIELADEFDIYTVGTPYHKRA